MTAVRQCSATWCFLLNIVVFRILPEQQHCSEDNTRWMCPIADSQLSLPQISTRQWVANVKNGCAQKATSRGLDPKFQQEMGTSVLLLSFALHTKPLSLLFLLFGTFHIRWILLSLADKTKLINESQGKSQRQLAARFSIGKTTVQNIPKRKRDYLTVFEENIAPSSKRICTHLENDQLDEKLWLCIIEYYCKKTRREVHLERFYYIYIYIYI